MAAPQTTGGAGAKTGAKIRSLRKLSLTVGSEVYSVDVVEIPFREGVELRCRIGEDEIRISDRQLGEREALRLLAEQIEKRIRPL